MTDEDNAAPEPSDLPDGVEDELREKYKGKLVTCDAGPLGAFAFKRATQGVHEKLVNQLSNEKTPAQSLREFALNCLVYPTDDQGKPNYEAGRALFQAYPEEASNIADAIRELPGKLDLKKR